MPTATAVKTKTTENRISAEQRTKIKQERAKLQQELEHCEENFELAKAALEAAADPALDSDVYVMAHRDYTIVQKKLTAKQAELARHRQTFLSDEEIAARDQEEQEAKEFAQREEARLAIAKPLQQKLQKALDDIFAAKRVFDEVHALLSSGQSSPLSNSYEVAVLCRTALRNFATPIPNHKFWMEGGGGEDAMRRIIASCA